ncbi:MAG: protein kinase, partial [Rhodanobacter sp.]
MNSIAELVSAYQTDKLKLPGLFEALGTLDPLSEAEYRVGIDFVEQQRATDKLDPLIAKALLAKLATLQPPSPTVHDDDVTMVKPTTRRPAAPPAPPAMPEDEATRVAPPSRPPPVPVDDDVTVVQPTSRPPQPSDIDEATVVKPVSNRPRTEGHGTSHTGTQGTQQGMTGTGSSMSSQSSWSHIGDAEAADFVAVGSLLKGRFHLEREIGRGGMGVVYLARDERKVEARDRDPYVAIKVLNDEFRRHPDSLISLQRESRRSQQLAHDNIVRV